MIPEEIKGLTWEKAREWLARHGYGLGQIDDIAKEFIENVVEEVKELYVDAVELAEDVIDAIKEKAAELFEDASKIGADLTEKAQETAIKVAEDIKSEVTKVAKKVTK